MSEIVVSILIMIVMAALMHWAVSVNTFFNLLEDEEPLRMKILLLTVEISIWVAVISLGKYVLA